MGLIDFQKRFPDEQACHEYLVKTRFPDGFACPRCDSSAVGEIATRNLWQCKRCRAQVSATTGTMFHRSRTSLHEWFWTILLAAKDKRGHFALQLSKELNIHYARAWLMLHKIRNAMAHRDTLSQLAGVIEMDEAYFGAPDPGQRGRGTRRTKALVALGLREDGKARFVKIKEIKRLDGRSAIAFAQTSVVRGNSPMMSQ